MADRGWVGLAAVHSRESVQLLQPNFPHLPLLVFERPASVVPSIGKHAVYETVITE